MSVQDWIRTKLRRLVSIVATLAVLSGTAVFSLTMATPASADASQGLAIVSAAASQSGEPYCLDGGNTAGPTHGSGGSGCGSGVVGFDCSGLALYAVYQATGIVLPHGAGMESASGGTVISNQSDLQPGDLVFFGGGSLANFDHVGVYAGNGEMWDANDYNVPVQEHSLAWEEAALAFDGGVRYWSSSGGSSYRAAFQTNINSLYLFDSSSGTMSTTQGMKSGTSPAIAALSGGGYEEAFQANTGNLIVVGDGGNVNTGQGMMAGTSPSIAAESSGGFRVAFQANNGYLYTYDSSSGATDVGWGMMSGTSPSITALANGYYEIALQASDGNLWLNGPVTSGNTHQGVASGTSPSISGLSSGYGYQVAFQANTGYLYTYTHTTSGDTTTATTQGMASGTSPAVAALSGGGYEEVFNAQNGDMFVYGSNSSGDTLQGMMSGTSPAITALSSNNFEATFQVNTGNLFIYSSATGKALDTQQGMASGTSPSLG